MNEKSLYGLCVAVVISVAWATQASAYFGTETKVPFSFHVQELVSDTHVEEMTPGDVVVEHVIFDRIILQEEALMGARQ